MTGKERQAGRPVPLRDRAPRWPIGGQAGLRCAAGERIKSNQFRRRVLRGRTGPGGPEGAGHSRVGRGLAPAAQVGQGACAAALSRCCRLGSASRIGAGSLRRALTKCLTKWGPGLQCPGPRSISGNRCTLLERPYQTSGTSSGPITPPGRYSILVPGFSSKFGMRFSHSCSAIFTSSRARCPPMQL